MRTLDMLTSRYLLSTSLSTSGLLLFYRTTAHSFNCLSQHDTPSSFLPKAGHCLNLADHLLDNPHAYSHLIWSNQPLPEKVPFELLPYVRERQSCRVTVIANGPPWHDFASMVSLAEFIQETASQCLLQGGRKDWGSVGYFGAHRFLTVSVTGAYTSDHADGSLPRVLNDALSGKNADQRDLISAVASDNSSHFHMLKKRERIIVGRAHPRNLDQKT